jgi:CHAT domain-containing protein/Tfp pilus assembly protein PilF
MLRTNLRFTIAVLAAMSAMTPTTMAVGAGQRHACTIIDIEGSLRNVRIEREGKPIGPVLPYLPLDIGDRLVVKGSTIVLLNCGPVRTQIGKSNSPYVVRAMGGPPERQDNLLAWAREFLSRWWKADESREDLAVRGSEEPLTLPLLASKTNFLVGNESNLLLGWEGGTPPYILSLESIGFDGRRADVVTATSNNKRTLAVHAPHPLAPGAYVVQVTDAQGQQAVASLKVVQPAEIPSAPTEIAPRSTNDYVGATLSAAWLASLEGGHFVLEAYQRTCRLASRHRPARILCDALGHGFRPEPPPLVAAGPGLNPLQLGIVLTDIGRGTALAKVGVHPGDLMLSWLRRSSFPSEGCPEEGRFESPFDWRWFETEQAPRGTVVLRLIQDGKERLIEVPPGKWDSRVSPSLPRSLLASYLEGKNLIDAGRLEVGTELWRALARTAPVGQELPAWLLLRSGEAWAAASNWPKAEASYLEALDAARGPAAQVTIWAALGDIYQKENRFTEARNAFQVEASVSEKEWGETLNLARARSQLALLDMRLGDMNSAEQLIQSAFDIRVRLAPMSLELAASIGSLGILALNRSDLAGAETLFDQELELSDRLAPESRDEAASLTNLGLVNYYRGQLSVAESLLGRALDIQNSLSLDPNLDKALILNNLAGVTLASGDIDLATKYDTAALEVRRRITPGSLEFANSLSNLALVLAARGDLAQADELQQQAADIQQRLAPDTIDFAASLDSMGESAFERGDLDLGERYFKRAFDLRSRLAPDGLEVAMSLSNLGALRFKRGDLAEAEDLFNRAIEILGRRFPNTHDLSKMLTNVGSLLLEGNRLDQAERSFQRANAIEQSLAPNSLEAANVLAGFGDLAMKRNDLAAAEDSNARALAIRERLAPGSSSEVETLASLARVHRQAKRPGIAETYLERAIDRLEKQVGKLGGSPDAKAGFRARFVNLYQELTELLLARGADEAAFSVLERSRARSLLAMLAERDLVFSRDIPIELERARRRLATEYDEIQEQLLPLSPTREHDKTDELLGRLREVRSQYELVGNRIREASPRLAALQYPEPLDFRGVQQALDPGTILLAYSVGQQETLLFVVEHEGPLRVLTLHLGEGDLRSQISDFIQKIKEAKGGPIGLDSYRKRDLLAAGGALFSSLLGPVYEILEKSERFVIAPDGPLHHLPWGALVSERPGMAMLGSEAEGSAAKSERTEYLVEWKPFNVVTSGTLFAQLKMQRQDSSATVTPTTKADLLPFAFRGIIAFGDPAYPRALGHARNQQVRDPSTRMLIGRGYTFVPLPGTRTEVESIAALFPGKAAAYLGVEATEEQAKALPRSAEYVHFAAHAVLDERLPLNSAIALTIPEPFVEGRDNGLLQAWEIYEQVRVKARLVVLSACESGLGRETRGEGLIGLVRAFQYAGASAVAASLWRVPDQTTAELMVEFYRNLRAGRAINESLRAAQIKLMHHPVQIRGEGRNLITFDASAPYYWAAFQIYGDWR